MTSKANENGEFKEVRLLVPVQQEDLEKLEIGTIVYLDGVIYTGREGVYKRVLEEGHDIQGDRKFSLGLFCR